MGQGRQHQGGGRGTRGRGVAGTMVTWAGEAESGPAVRGGRGLGLRGPAFLCSKQSQPLRPRASSSFRIWKRGIHPALLGEFLGSGANGLKHLGQRQVDRRCTVPRRTGNKPVTTSQLAPWPQPHQKAGQWGRLYFLERVMTVSHPMCSLVI